METNYRKVYTLLAQTPMLHFQAYEPGACLRATEVKPRLDHYLNQCEVIPTEWTHNRRHNSLLYQLRITALEDRPEIPHIKACKANFSKDYGLLYRDCRLEILCFIPGLLEIIHRHIKTFFILHNFGSRQSKGFGSFLVAGTSQSEIHQSIKEQYANGFYADFSGSAGERLNVAYAVFSVMKSGVNLSSKIPGAYIKGYALGKFLPAGIGSDKAFIKSHVLPADDGRDYPREGFAFIRALLGLAETYDYKDKFRNDGVSTQLWNDQQKTVLRPLRVQVDHYDGTVEKDGKLTIPLESIEQDLGIRRFQSPLLIKIIGDRIWFLLNDQWKLMLGQTFLIHKKSAFRVVNDLRREKDFVQAQQILEQFPHITTPDTFDPAAFMDGFVTYFNSPETGDALRRFQNRDAEKNRYLGYEMYLASRITLTKL